MQRTRLSRFVFLPALFCALLSTSIYAGNTTPIDLTKYYRVTVAAGTTPHGQLRLKQLIRRVRELAGFANLEDDWIGCQNCTNVEDNIPKPNVVFVIYREHERSRDLLMQAWGDVHSGTNGLPNINDFTILTDALPLSAPACPAPPPNCTNVPSCVSTDGCDKYLYQSGCQKCQ
jgi:hypothetical protein